MYFGCCFTFSGFVSFLLYIFICIHILFCSFVIICVSSMFRLLSYVFGCPLISMFRDVVFLFMIFILNPIVLFSYLYVFIFIYVLCSFLSCVNFFLYCSRLLFLSFPF